jgi:hypothetical protein
MMVSPQGLPPDVDGLFTAHPLEQYGERWNRLAGIACRMEILALPTDASGLSRGGIAGLEAVWTTRSGYSATGR